MWHLYYRNPFPDDINNHLERLNNIMSDMNKYIRDIRKNYKGLENINEKNTKIDLGEEIIGLEEEVAQIAHEITQSQVVPRMQKIRNKLRNIREKYGTHDTIRRQMREKYVDIVAYPPWDIIYDKAMGLGGEVHVGGKDYSSFIVPDRHVREFLDFVRSLKNFQYQGLAPKRTDSYLIKYLPNRTNPHWGHPSFVF